MIHFQYLTVTKIPHFIVLLLYVPSMYFNHKCLIVFSTYMNKIGKWDAGMATWDHTPAGRGYDTSFGYFHHDNDYFTEAVGPVIDLWDTFNPAFSMNNSCLNYYNGSQVIQFTNRYSLSSNARFYLHPFSFSYVIRNLCKACTCDCLSCCSYVAGL